MTGWGAVLLVSFMAYGLGHRAEPQALRRALVLTAIVLTAVSLGVL